MKLTKTERDGNIISMSWHRTRRVSANYRFVLTFNSALIALGAMGILQPASSAMLHNLSTIGISLKSMTNLIPEEKAQKALVEKN